MEKRLTDLLEELDKAFPNAVSRSQLQQHDFNNRLVIEAFKKGLIDCPYNMDDLKNKFEHDSSIPVILSEKGLMLLSQVRMDKSIKQFDKSSQVTAWVMIGLSIVMTILTVVMLLKQ